MTNLMSVRMPTVRWYVEKYQMKMLGSDEDIAKDWVLGINADTPTTELIWAFVKDLENFKTDIYN